MLLLTAAAGAASASPPRDQETMRETSGEEELQVPEQKQQRKWLRESIMDLQKQREWLPKSTDDVDSMDREVSEMAFVSMYSACWCGCIKIRRSYHLINRRSHMAITYSGRGRVQESLPEESLRRLSGTTLWNNFQVRRHIVHSACL